MTSPNLGHTLATNIATALGVMFVFVLVGSSLMLGLPTLFDAAPSEMAGTLFFGSMTLGVVCVASAGVAVTAVVPPLPPVADTSVLGRRTMGLAKFALATAAVFAAAYTAWLVAALFEEIQNGDTAPEEALGRIWEHATIVLGFAAVVYWLWLSVDLIRIGRRRRLNALDRLFHLPNLTSLRFLRHFAAYFVGGTWRILGAFYFAPLLLLSLWSILLPTPSGS